jgi:hypothetical protein
MVASMKWWTEDDAAVAGAGNAYNTVVHSSEDCA